MRMSRRDWTLILGNDDHEFAEYISMLPYTPSVTLRGGGKGILHSFDVEGCSRG